MNIQCEARLWKLHLNKAAWVGGRVALWLVGIILRKHCPRSPQWMTLILKYEALGKSARFRVFEK